MSENFVPKDDNDAPAKHAAWIANGISQVLKGEVEEFKFRYRDMNTPHVMTREFPGLGIKTLQVIGKELGKRIEPPIDTDELLK